MKPIKRLFLVVPLMVIFMVLSVTIIISLFYWVLTGNDWIELIDEIIYISEH